MTDVRPLEAALTSMSVDPSTKPGIVIRRIVESDRDALRSLRLRALSTDPMSFASTFDRESKDEGEKWIGWTRRGSTSPEMAVLVAELVPGRLIGMVGAFSEGEATHIYGMWVEPGHRNLGLGGKLLDAILAWVETSHPLSEIRLGVVPSSDSAVRLYRSRGFVRSGKVEPLPHSPEVVWHEMVRVRERPNRSAGA